MKYLTFAFAVLALIGCDTRTTLPNINFNAPTLVVFNDVGGDPYEYAALWIRLNETGKEVQLGECNSSCTMLLSLPRACLMAGTRFGFHKSSGLVREEFIAQYLPPGLVGPYLSTWSKSTAITRFTAEELQAMDPSLRICKTQPLSAR